MVHGGEIYDKKIEYDFSVNLNPNPCPEEVLSALHKALLQVDKYPDQGALEFRKKVALAENKLSGGEFITEKNVIGGNGASELIMAVIRMLAPGNVLLADPCFWGYRHGLEQLENVNVRTFLLEEKEGFELTESFADEITEDTDLVILTNPNNPTCRAIKEEVLELVLDKCRETGTFIIIDECFLQLSENAVSAVKFIRENKRLFIINAYTKLFSIPGVRIGYAISQSENIERLKAFLPEWNMSVFAQLGGAACADHLLKTDFASKSKAMVSKQKKELALFLESLGIEVYPSDSCFLLVKSSKDIYNRLLKKGILIRDCSNFHGLGKDYYRISVSGYWILQDPELWV